MGWRIARWGSLRRGDTILCPETGQPERVARDAAPGARGTAIVRTRFHDHIRPASEIVPTTRKAQP